jgi:O-antigen/teichoic acid export membrane protein
MSAATVIRRRHSGAHGATLALADQLVSSASNFALGVLIARAGGAGALGAFGIAFVVWVAVLGVNRALVAEPMTVAGSTEDPGSQLGEGLSATLVLGVVVAAALALLGGALLLVGLPTGALLALAPWLPSLLAQEYFRLMAFRLQRPLQALISDIVFAATQAGVIVALYALDERSVAAFLTAWGMGATFAAAASFAMRGMRASDCRGGVAHLQGLWTRSRWFLAEFGTSFVAGQGYLLLLPILLSTAEFGVFRAGQSLIGPIVVLFLAGAGVGLPECVRRLRHNGVPGLTAYASRLTAVVVLVAGAYCGVVALLAAPLLRLTYGESFTDAAVITLLIAVTYIIAALPFGYGQALKAAEQLRLLWFLRAVSAAVSIVAMVVFVNAFGLVGAGWASIVTATTYTVGVLLGYHRMRRNRAIRAPQNRGCHRRPMRAVRDDDPVDELEAAARGRQHS